MKRNSSPRPSTLRSAATLVPTAAALAVGVALILAASDFLGSQSAAALLPPLPEPVEKAVSAVYVPSAAYRASASRPDRPHRSDRPSGQGGPDGVERPQADTLRYAVYVGGNPAGEEHVVREPATADAPERWHIRYAFNDRGRGPELEAELLVDAATSLPVRLEVHGLNYTKSRVDESFGAWKDGHPATHPAYHPRLDDDPAASFRGAEAVWLSEAEEGRRELEGPALYLPLHATPTLQALLARALLRSPSGCLETLPSGRACIERRGRAELGPGFGPAARGPLGAETAARERGFTGELEVILYGISGLGFSPVHVWLEPDGTFFASGSGFTRVVRRGWQGAMERLADWERRSEDEWLAELAESIPERPEGTLAIRNARLFDPWTLEVRPGTTVLVREGRIQAAGPDDDVEIPAAAHVIEAEGRTLLPGLFDMHVHLRPVDGLLHLAGGVTTVRDLGNDPDRVRSLKRSFQEGTAIGPRVLLAGILDGPGPFAGPTQALVDTDEEAREWIHRYADLGFGQVKLYSSLAPALVPGIVREAKERGLRVSGHVPAFMTARQAAEAGFDEIQHVNMLVLNFLGDTLDTRTPLRLTEPGVKARELDLGSDSVRAFLRLLAERDVVVDPTLAIFENLLTSRAGRVGPGFRTEADRFPPTVRRGLLTGGLPVPAGADEAYRDSVYAVSFQSMVALTGELHRAGVRLVAGTDAMAGFALHRELELYVRAGIPAPEVLRIATLGAARVAGRADELGSVEEGKRADLVLVDGEPEREISHIRRPWLVIKDGVLYDPRRLHAAVGIGD